jgi:hypothetical protein
VQAQTPQDKMTQYNCKWEAMRTEADQEFRPFGNGRDPGTVSVSFNKLFYAPDNKYKRNTSNPGRIENGNIRSFYIPEEINKNNTGDAVIFVQLSNGQRQILLNISAMKTQLAGSCMPL